MISTSVKSIIRYGRPVGVLNVSPTAVKVMLSAFRRLSRFRIFAPNAWVNGAVEIGRNNWEFQCAGVRSPVTPEHKNKDTMESLCSHHHLVTEAKPAYAY